MPENNNTNGNRRQRRTPQPVDNTYGHLQPQAIEVEKTMLGALMTVGTRPVVGALYGASLPTLWVGYMMYPTLMIGIV